MAEHNLVSSIRPIIEEKIEQLGREYERMKGLILTESDLKYQLFRKLTQIRELSIPRKTEDKNIYSTAIHSELSWFDRNGKLSITPDISIIEPGHLSILRGNTFGFKLPSKGYTFSGGAILFELKFVRLKTGITTHIFKKQIMSDYNKIRGLKEKLDETDMGNSIFCYFIIFNKTNIACKDFKEFLINNSQGDYYKFIYKTGNVVFRF